MSWSDALKPYIFDLNNRPTSRTKYEFYPVSENEIVEAEKRVGFRFPVELAQFYREIGWGFLPGIEAEVNRILDPKSVADYRQNEDVYEYKPDGELFSDSSFLVFFEIIAGSFLAIKMNEFGPSGKNPIYHYYLGKVAESLEEFVKKMDENPNYFMRGESK